MENIINNEFDRIFKEFNDSMEKIGKSAKLRFNKVCTGLESIGGVLVMPDIGICSYPFVEDIYKEPHLLETNEQIISAIKKKQAYFFPRIRVSKDKVGCIILPACDMSHRHQSVNDSGLGESICNDTGLLKTPLDIEFKPFRTYVASDYQPWLTRIGASSSFNYLSRPSSKEEHMENQALVESVYNVMQGMWAENLREER